MTLTTLVEQNGTEFEIDLDALDRYGSYYVDRERVLIIHASVYTQGTPDSRHLRGDVICGMEYTLERFDVDREQVREYIRDELHVEITDETLDNAIAEYLVAGMEVVGDFDETLDRYRILSKATSGAVSTEINESLAGWEQTSGKFVDRVEKQHPQLTRREIVRILFSALQTASPGDSEYTARITLVTRLNSPLTGTRAQGVGSAHPGLYRSDHRAHISPVFSQHPRFRIGILLANRRTVTTRCRVEHADVLELLDKIEQHIRPDDVLPDGFFLVDAGCLTCLDQFSCRIQRLTCRTCSGRRSGTRGSKTDCTLYQWFSDASTSAAKSVAHHQVS